MISIPKTIILPTIIFIVLIAVAIGCTPGATPRPLPDQPEGEVQVLKEDVTPETEATEEPEPWPPFVLRTKPERGEEQPIDAPVEITFDQPMDRDSVERSFAIEPGASVDGTFDWVDDQTIHFAFADGFERGQRYKVRIIESAKSEAGLQMERPFELRFSTVGFLEVTNVQPADEATEVLPDTIVTVLFNRPVVPLNAIEDSASLPDPLTFVPPAQAGG
jgi:hypothetical protein